MAPIGNLPFHLYILYIQVISYYCLGWYTLHMQATLCSSRSFPSQLEITMWINFCMNFRTRNWIFNRYYEIACSNLLDSLIRVLLVELGIVAVVSWIFAVFHYDWHAIWSCFRASAFEMMIFVWIHLYKDNHLASSISLIFEKIIFFTLKSTYILEVSTNLFEEIVHSY